MEIALVLRTCVIFVPESVIVEEDHIEGNPLLPVLSFIEALTNHCLDGRVVASQGTTVGNSSLKFLLLNPAAHFSDIVKEARFVCFCLRTPLGFRKLRNMELVNWIN